MKGRIHVLTYLHVLTALGRRRERSARRRLPRCVGGRREVVERAATVLRGIA
jgi:hypothetical protein